MAAFLSVDESLRFWRSDDPSYCGETVVSPAENVLLSEAVGRMCDIDHLHLEEYADADGRLELLVPDAARRSRSKKLGFRVIGADLPRGSFYRAKRSVYVCSPELLLILFAEKASIFETIALGCELCGSYSARTGGNLKHAALTCVEAIEEYLGKVKMLKGAKRCRKALKYIENGSASPRETDLYMMLCLPSKLRGFGLGGALLNDPQEVGRQHRSKTNLKKITPDLLWKGKKVAIEYDSNEYHIDRAGSLDAGRSRLSNDSERRRTYKAIGISVVTVTNDEFIDFDEIERIATLLAKLLGKHGIRRDGILTLRRQQLHEWLRVPVLERGVPSF